MAINFHRISSNRSPRRDRTGWAIDACSRRRNRYWRYVALKARDSKLEAGEIRGTLQ